MAEAAAREKLEQIVRACFLKAVEVILHARIVPYSVDLRRGKLNRTFNIELDELDSVRRELGGWDPANPLPLFIDVMLDLGGGSSGGAARREASEPAGEHGRTHGRAASSDGLVLLERWQLLYIPSRQSLERLQQAALYKRCAVLLRALHARLRLMPAQRLSRRLASRPHARAESAESDGFALPSTPSCSPLSAAGSGEGGGDATQPSGSHEQPSQPIIRVLFAVQLGEAAQARPVPLTADGASELPPASASFPAGASPHELSLQPADPVHVQFHVSALFCSERERPLRLASTRCSLAAVAMHTHGTIIPDYLDAVRSGADAQGALGRAAADEQPRPQQRAQPASAAHAQLEAQLRGSPQQHTPPPRGLHAQQRPQAQPPGEQVTGFTPRQPSPAAAAAARARGGLVAVEGSTSPHGAARGSPEPARLAHGLLAAGLQAGLHGCAPRQPPSDTQHGGGASGVGAFAAAAGGGGGGGGLADCLSLHARASAGSPTMIGAGTSPPLGAAAHAAAHARVQGPRGSAEGSPLPAGSPLARPCAQQPALAQHYSSPPFGSDGGRVEQLRACRGSSLQSGAMAVPVPHAASSPVAIPVHMPSSHSHSRSGSSAAATPGAGPFGSSRPDADYVRAGSWERGAAIVPVGLGAVGRATSDASGRVARAGRSPGGGFLQESPHSWTHAQHLPKAGSQRERTPPQGVRVPVQLVGRGGHLAGGAGGAACGAAGGGAGGDEDLRALFRPVRCSSSPPLFGTSPPALAASGSAFLLPMDDSLVARRMHSAVAGPPIGAPSAAGSSASPHASSLSSKMSSCRGSPSLEVAPTGSGGMPGSSPGQAGAGAGQRPTDQQHQQLAARAALRAGVPHSSSAPAAGLRPIAPDSHRGLGFGPEDLDTHGFFEGADAGTSLGGTLHAHSLSRSVIGLSRDLDALRMSLNLGTAGEHADEGRHSPPSQGISRRSSLDPHAQHGAQQPQREWLRRSTADAFDERGLIFPFAPICDDHCREE